MTVISGNMAASSEDNAVRRRRVDSRRQKETQTGDSGGEHAADSDSGPDTEPTPGSLQTGTYWLSRIVLLRSVAFIYCEWRRTLHRRDRNDVEGLMTLFTVLNELIVLSLNDLEVKQAVNKHTRTHTRLQI